MLIQDLEEPKSLPDFKNNAKDLVVEEESSEVNKAILYWTQEQISIYNERQGYVQKWTKSRE